MEGFLAVIIVVIALAVSANKTKKAAKNVPGRQNAARPAAPVKPAQRQTAPVRAAKPVESARHDKDSDQPHVLDESDYARADLEEGDSRECDHGSVGGSMDITDHAGMGEEFVHAQQTVKTSVATSVKTQVKVNSSDIPSETELEEEKAAEPKPDAASVRRNAVSMNAEQMRQAVVMAEILKRPSERFRRWPVR